MVYFFIIFTTLVVFIIWYLFILYVMLYLEGITLVNHYKHNIISNNTQSDWGLSIKPIINTTKVVKIIKKYTIHVHYPFSKYILHQPYTLTINQNTIHLPLEHKNKEPCTPQHWPIYIYIHSLMRTKFSTINDDDQSHHHSEINKNCKNFIYTFKILNNSLFSHTNSNTHLLQKTLTQFKNTIHLPLGVKKQKNLHSITLTIHTHTHLLQNIHWWEQSSQLFVMMTKVIITQE